MRQHQSIIIVLLIGFQVSAYSLLIHLKRKKSKHSVHVSQDINAVEDQHYIKIRTPLPPRDIKSTRVYKTHAYSII